MCDERKDRLALRIYLPEKGAAGKISLRNTALEDTEQNP